MKLKSFIIACASILTVGCISANKNKPMNTDTFKTKSGLDVVFTAIKHASMEIKYKNIVFEIDPVSTACQPATDYSKMAKADYIIVTHEHQDHFDKVAISDLSKPSTVIITNKNCGKEFSKCTVMANGDSTRLADDIMLYAVPAYNTTPGHTQFHPKGRDNGFILVLDGLRIYIAGDTEDIPELKQIKDIDVAFLPCNQPFTMTPTQMRNAAKTIRPKVLFPYHYSDTSPEDMMKATKGLDIDVRIRDYK